MAKADDAPAPSGAPAVKAAAPARVAAFRTGLSAEARAAAFLMAAATTLSAAPAFAQLAPPDKNGLTYGVLSLNVKDIAANKHIWVDVCEGTLVEKNGITAGK